MFKRKKQITVCAFPCEDSFYREQRKVSTEIDDNGYEQTRSYLEKIPCTEINAELLRISPDDYTLKKLLKAGVQLEQVNLNGFFGSSDPIDIDAKNAPLVEDAFNKLKAHDWKMKTQNENITSENINNNEN